MSRGTAAAAHGLRFPIRVGRWSNLVLLPWGILPGRADVRITDSQVACPFGFFGARGDLADIERWDITGPYRWWRAIAVRHTLGSQDISFCGAAHGTVRLWLRSPRRLAWVRAVRQIHLGVDDLVGFAAELTRRGIPGEDLRTPG